MSCETKKPQEEKIDDWRTQFNWEKLYKILTFSLIAFMPFFIKDMFLFRNEITTLGLQLNSINFAIYGIISAVVFTLVRMTYFQATHNIIYSKILDKYDDEQKELHTKKVQKWTFDMIYYSATSIYGFICFREAPWYPITFSKGEDSTMGTFTDWPDLPHQHNYYPYFNSFLIVQFGHHIWALFDLIFVRRKIENRFYEWFLHHLLAFTLIFYSVYFNFSILAVAVLIIHDIGDIFLVMFKTYGEWHGSGVIFKYLVFQMIAGWFVTRVFLYPKVIIMPIIYYRQLYYKPIETTPYLQYANAGYIYQTLMLSLLYLMHIYWFAQMITLLSSYIKKSLKPKQRGEKKNNNYGNEFDYYHYNKKDKQQKVE